jgi:hypothetical protein
MPFVDPFRQDWRDFEQLSSMTGLIMLTHSEAMLAARPVCQEPFQESLISSPQHVIHVAATIPRMRPELADTDAELQEAVSGSGPVRLTADMAIHIFNQGKTKTKHSAALLSAEFGVSAKAIRDIWTKRT